jgi:hypothetical protein
MSKTWNTVNNTWNAIKSLPGYGRLYQAAARFEDRYPTVLYALVAGLLMLPVLIVSGLASRP